MKIKTVAIAILAALPLASCAGGMYPSADGSRHWGSPQVAGWTTSSDVREAGQKSIARDMPFATVTAQGKIVQR